VLLEELEDVVNWRKEDLPVSSASVHGEIGCMESEVSWREETVGDVEKWVVKLY
jgi:hypothetical protein